MYSYLLLLIFGCSCFCVAINPIESPDWDTSLPEISDYSSLDNCTQCSVETLCYYLEYDNECIECCSSVCCFCADYTPCRYKHWKLIVIMMQVGICILFGFSFIGLIIVYCKLCKRTTRTRERRRCIVLHEERDLTRCDIIEGLRDRPPSYNEVTRNIPPVCTSSSNSAPPLYTSPHNRTSMQEAPPSYPGTPKPQDKLQNTNEPPSSAPVAQHM